MRRALFTLNAADVQAYRVADDLSGVLIIPMIIFGPWAFGTTQSWSIWTMNIGSFALGFLLMTKLFIREVKGYPAPRWETLSPHSETPLRRRNSAVRFLTRSLAVLTLAVLAYCLISALNAAAIYNTDTRSFEYRGFLAWLPHSFDGQRTWFHFWMYLGLACSFWGIWDWLLGMTADEESNARFSAKVESVKSSRHLSARLRCLLWVICINGALVGIEAIIQRICGSTKLLFLAQPLVNPEGEAQFGPYAYRANAAQYFNLIWPLCLGFWWALHRAHGFRAGSHHVLLACAAIMAACPIISTSRGGALVSAGLLVPSIFFLAAASILSHQSRRSTLVLIVVFFVSSIALGWFFGWDTLEPRMEQIGEGYKDREDMYESARPMAADYPVFGVGPGTFATVFKLYRISNSTYWPEQLHNDWLETRITFGWVGLALLLAALMCVVFRWFAPGGIRTSKWFLLLAWLGPAGCLVHALFDFPFQIYSILFLFLVICAALFSLTRKSRGS
jgi:hypothetical protein